MSLFKRAVLPFDFVVLVCCGFVFLTLGAMALYPGGTALDSHSRGYHFFVNFFSDLGRTYARNNEPNPYGSKLFWIALTSAGLALGIFFLGFARFFWGHLGQRVAITASVAFGLMSAWDFVGIALNPANLNAHAHVHYVFSAFRLFPIAIFFCGIAMTMGRTYPKRGLWIFAAFFVVLVAYLSLITHGPSENSPQGLLIQATGQKIVVYASLLCVGLQSLIARRHLSAQMRSNASS